MTFRRRTQRTSAIAWAILAVMIGFSALARAEEAESRSYRASGVKREHGNDPQNSGTLEGHTLVLSSVAFSPDGKRIVTGSWDNTAMIWDADSGQEISVFTGHKPSAPSL